MTAARRRATDRVVVDTRAGNRLGGGSRSTLKRFVVGRPLATHAQDSELLPKRIALPVFSSDAVSSTAYGTEVMLTVLVPVAGVAALGYLVPLSLILIGVLVLLVLSYRQTIYAYPNGGGSYIVSRENLGTNPSLVAAAALLVDYTLNVAVSAAAGAAAISSAVKPLQNHPVALSLGLVVVIMFANLHGLREAGRLFALPVYTYVAVLTGLIVDGLIRSFTGSLHRLPVDHTQLNTFTHNGALVTGITLFALMKAFSSGAVALSGVEAISNGVPAFREPKSKNASVTLMWTGIFLGAPLLGLAVLTERLRPTISTKETSSRCSATTCSAEAARCTSCSWRPPRRSCVFRPTRRSSTSPAVIDRRHDGFLHQFAKRGDRLVFSNGIIAVAASAAVLLWAFAARSTR